jgi:hypothetical protein
MYFLYWHVFVAESQLNGVLQVQVPAEPVALHTKFVILVSQSIEDGVADESHAAPPRPTFILENKQNRK